MSVVGSTHFAPTELDHFGSGYYKHFAPTELIRPNAYWRRLYWGCGSGRVPLRTPRLTVLPIF